MLPNRRKYITRERFHMLNFFQRLQQQHNKDLDEPLPIEETAEFRSNARQYIHFCQSRVNQGSHEMILKDLKELLQTRGITHIAFSDNDRGFELLLGTEHIYLRDPKSGKVHDIGEFVIIVNRKNKQIRFLNITHPLTQQVDGVAQVAYHHPHVSGNGAMCIVEGREQMNEYLTEGQMAPLARMLIKALYTVDQVPYTEARPSNWPVKEA